MPDEQVASPGGRLLTKLRQGKRLSQRALSKSSQVSVGYISALETGKKVNPGADILSKLADALQLNENLRKQLREAFAEEGEIARDQALQRMANEEVWVVTRRPEELSNPDYLSLVIEGLQRGLTYTYWTHEPEHFDDLLETLKTIMNSDSHSLLLDHIACIKTPREANWFSFVIYDPRNSNRTWGNVSLTKSGRLSTPIRIDDWTLSLIRVDLEGVYSTLRTMKSSTDMAAPEYRHYKWHYPTGN